MFAGPTANKQQRLLIFSLLHSTLTEDREGLFVIRFVNSRCLLVLAIFVWGIYRRSKEGGNYSLGFNIPQVLLQPTRAVYCGAANTVGADQRGVNRKYTHTVHYLVIFFILKPPTQARTWYTTRCLWEWCTKDERSKKARNLFAWLYETSFFWKFFYLIDLRD